MCLRRFILYFTFLLFNVGCSLNKDTGYNDGILGLNMMALQQTQALVYVSNAGGSFGVDSIRTSYAGGISMMPQIAASAAPSGILATSVGSGHVLSAIPSANKVNVLDVTSSPGILKTLNVGTSPRILFVDPANPDHNWLMNDGDGSGADPILCPGQPTKGSFTVIHDSPDPVILATVHTSICVGLGPHKAASQTVAPFIALITNEGNNTISVVDNDEESATFLSSSLLNTISLSATPKEIVYSTYTDKFYVYLPSSGGGDIAVIDPAGNGTVGTPITGVGSKFSVLKIDATGRYLLLSGTDTSVSPNTGLLRSVDLHTGSIGTLITASSVGFSDIQMSPDGKNIFVATASADSSSTKDQLYMYSTTSLPNFSFVKSAAVGIANNTYRTFSLNVAGSSLLHLFVPNYSDGTISILNGNLDLLQTVTVGGNPTYTTIYATGSGVPMNMGNMSGM